MKHVLPVNISGHMWWWSYQNCIIKLEAKYILTASTLCLIPYLKDIPHVKHLSNEMEIIIDHNNKTIPICSSTKFLGLTVDCTLSWRHHIDLVTKN